MTSQRSVPHLTRLSRKVHGLATIEQLHMTTKQLAVLAYLRDNKGDMPQQSLCGAMHMSQNTVVAWLNELEELGFISRLRDPDDRRKHNVTLTETGRAALDHGEGELRKLEDQVFSGLTEAERTQLRTLLAKALETHR